MHKKGYYHQEFFIKSLSHGTKTNFHKELKIDKFIITSIDQEHGVIDKVADDLFIKPRRYKRLKFCDTYFCWGNDFKYLKKFKKFILYFRFQERFMESKI